MRTAASTADRLTIYIAEKGNMLVHDIAVHTPIFLPAYILEILYQRARFVVELVDFFRDFLKKEIKFNSTKPTKVYRAKQKKIEAIMQSLMDAEASAHDEITGNSSIFFTSLLVSLGKGEELDESVLNDLFNYGFNRPTLEGQGFAGFYNHIHSFFHGGKWSGFSSLPTYALALEGVQEPSAFGAKDKAWIRKVFDQFVVQKPWVKKWVGGGPIVDRPKTDNYFLGEMYSRRREILEATLLAQILESQNPPRPTAPLGRAQNP